MAALKEPVKIFIVQALACRDTPQEVAELVKQEFGVITDRMQCASYDPTKAAGRNLSKKFQYLFEETRKKFDEGLIDIPIANKHYRMKQYDKLLNKTKNTVTALKIMEQAAKDSGGLFTNRKEITGANGGPVETIQSQTTVEDYLTPTFQATVNALCALNNWPKHEVYLGEKTKQLNTDQADRDVKLKNAGANLTQQYFIREYGLMDGDIAELPPGQPEQQFKALSNRPFSFAASVKDLTQEQQELDELAEAKMQLFSDADIKNLIANSTGIEDLQNRLFDLAGKADTSQFNELMDRALFAADILGYVHSKEGR